MHKSISLEYELPRKRLTFLRSTGSAFENSEWIPVVPQEMFPTTVRGFVMGFLSSLGRVASSIAQVPLP